MAEQPKKNDWVYVAVESTAGREGYVGYDDEAGFAYIPAFYEKEAAQACFLNLPRDLGKKYEVQAVLFEELARDAVSNSFLIFMLDSEGRILLKINPQAVLDQQEKS